MIGGGHEAEEKVTRLMEAGARVRLVSPNATEALQQAASDGCLEWRQREYEAQDMLGVFLVMNTVRGDTEWMDAVFREAERLGALINTYDDVERSHFGMAALVRSGPLRISISTSNASPTLASRLRQDLQEMFGGDFAEFLQALGTTRQHLKEKIPEFSRRRKVLHSLVEGARLEGCFRFPTDWRQRVSAARAETEKPGQEPGSETSNHSNDND